MKTFTNYGSSILITLVFLFEALPGNEYNGVYAQRMHPPHGGRDPIPIPLPLPAQPGYVIIPKASYKSPHGGHPQIQQQHRLPNHSPPHHSFNKHEKQPPPPPPQTPQNKQSVHRVPAHGAPQDKRQNNEPVRRPPISSHVLPHGDQVIWHSDNVHVKTGVNFHQPQFISGHQKSNLNNHVLNQRNKPQNPPQNVAQHSNVILGPNVKISTRVHPQVPPGFLNQQGRPLQGQIFEGGNLNHHIQLPPSPDIHVAHFLSEDQSLQFDAKLKNALQKENIPAHQSVILHSQTFTSGEPKHEIKKPEGLILPQTDAALPPDIAHLIIANDENIIPDHGRGETLESHHGEHLSEKEIVFLNNEVEPKTPGPNKPVPEPQPYASAQALHAPPPPPPPPSSLNHAADGRRAHEPYHLPRSEYLDQEPKLPGNPTNFKPPPARAINNRILTPQEVKTNDIAGPQPERDYHLSEESAPVSLYGEVLPANEPVYNSEVSNYHGGYDSSESWPLPSPEMPKIVNLDVKCAKNMMRVSIDFDKPFHGIIYSKGHYSQGRCVHLPAGSGHTSVNFDISINSCGMHGNSATGNYGPTETGSYFENIIIVQYDPLVQEVWDQARRLRCNWHDQYEKTVTFRPFNVDMLHVVRADFAGDNVGCWMQIQVGKGPWASEVSGIVRIGQTMTLVLAIKDDENKFDMLVRNCIAHDGYRTPIELVDSDGCIVRPKLMSRFTKVKNFGSSASVLSFAHFQAFKFPDSTDVHIQCTVQICRGHCVDQCSSLRKKRSADNFLQDSDEFAVNDTLRNRRDADSDYHESREVGLNSLLQVVAVEDLSFSPFENETTTRETIEEGEAVCMSKSGFAASLILLLSVVIIACLLASFLYLRQRVEINAAPPPYDMAVYKKNMEKETKKQLKELGKL